MTHKQIDAAREARLWLGQIVIPLVTTFVVTVVAIPESRHAVAEKAKDVKESFKRKFDRKKKKP